MQNQETVQEITYAGPWVEISPQHFLRYRIDKEHDESRDKIPMGRVIGKTKKGIAGWTWSVMTMHRYVSTTTGTCTNKRDAIRACDEALKQERVLLLKPRHYSFL
jgi:hypothetical protein